MRLTIALLMLPVLSACTDRQSLSAVTYDLTLQYPAHTGDIELRGGKTVSLTSFRSPDTRLLFEDPKPSANWGRDAELRVVDLSGKILEKAKIRMPPRQMEKAKIIEGPQLPVPKQAEFKIDPLAQKYRVKNADKHYALFINGDAEQRHWNDTAFGYRILTQIYGLSKENIYVADSVYQKKTPDLDGDSKSDIAFGSTVKEVRALLDKMKTDVPKDAHLFVMVNDHGDITDGQATLVLYDGEMTATDFSDRLNAIAASSVISLFGQCYSGAFVRPTIRNNRVSVAASTSNELSFATEDFNFDEFVYHFLSGLAQQDHRGNRVNSDLNSNGRISLLESFLFATFKDLSEESPLIEAPANSGLSRRMGVEVRPSP